MFNSYSNNQHFNFNINAVSGTLRKSHPKSKMMIRKLERDMVCFSDDEPKVYSSSREEIIILQTMLIGDNRALIEYVNKKDFEADIVDELEVRVYVAITTEPNCTPTCKTFSDKDAAEKYIVGFAEYALQSLLPDENGLEFTCYGDILLWVRANKEKLPGTLRCNSYEFCYVECGIKYSANFEEHKIPINLK